jgi:hypothetical protein
MADNAALLKSALDGVQVLLKNAKPDTNSDGKPWRQTLSKPEMHLAVFESDVPGSSLRRFKGVIDLPFQADFVQTTVHDCKTRLTWDTNIAALDTLPVVTAEEAAASASASSTPGAAGPTPASPRLSYAFVLRSATKAVGPISARDFVDVTAVVDIGGGSFASGGAGAVDARFPEQSGFVRGWNSSGGGWLFEAVPPPGGPADAPKTWTRIHYVIHCDLKGWLPSMAVNGALTGSYVTFYTDLLKHMNK